MKRMPFVLLSFVLLLSLVLAGCSDEKTSSGTEKTKDKKGASVVTNAGTFPITKEKVTLSAMILSNPLVKDFETNAFTEWYEKKTNVNIEWRVVPQENAEQKLNLVLASGNLPDIIMDMPVTNAQLMVYGKKGLFLPLNDLIEKYGVQTKKMFGKVPIAKKVVTAPDGNIYALPTVNECFHCSMGKKMWIYKPWLEKLNLEMPKTTEEFYHVLKTFKTQDPNGNGKADEIPLAGSPKSWHGDVTWFLMNSFIYNDMFIKNGKIDVPFNKPEYKKGLKYLHKLYADGLIASGSFTQSAEQLKQMGMHPGKVILGAATGGHQGVFTKLYADNGRWLNYTTVPPLKGPDGTRHTWYDPVPAGPTFIITKSAEHPAVAFRWADAMYKKEVTLRSVYGRPGKEWRWAKDGEIAINGKEATWASIDTFGHLQNIAWKQSGHSLRTQEFRSSRVANKDKPLEIILYDQTKKNYQPYIPDKDMLVPPLYFTEQQSKELANLKQTIETYRDEMKAKFIAGQIDIDKGWENYIQTLESMGLDRYLEIYQEAYEAKYKN